MLYIIVLASMMLGIVPTIVGGYMLLAIVSFDIVLAFITRSLICYRGFDTPGAIGSKVICSNLDEISSTKSVYDHDLVSTTADALCNLSWALHEWGIRLVVTNWLAFTPICIHMYKSLLLSYTCRLMKYTSKEYRW